MKHQSFVITAIMLSFFFIIPISLSAQSGSLDLSFDTDGIVTTPIGVDDDFALAIAMQADGKIVVAGYSINSTTASDIVLSRYNSNGSLDNTFDSDGKVITSVGTSNSVAHAIAIQNDGKIIVAGYSYTNTSGNDFTLVRYNVDGSLDSTFDADGIVSTPMGGSSNDRAFCIAIQSDGKILAGGYQTDIITSTQRNFALVRYNANGSLDNSFGIGGVVGKSLANGNDEARSIAIQSDGKIVAVGYSFDFTTRKFALLRYTTDGILDNTFDTDGIVTTSIGGGSIDDAAYGAIIQTDGKIVACGYSHGSTYDFAVVRYNSDGGLDNSFDTDGIAITSIGTSATSSDEAHAITLQNDGKILVAGHADYDFGLVRYNTDGSLDNSFDADGKVTTDISSPAFYDNIEAITLQTDGQIVVAGSTSNGTNYDFTLARYYGNNSSGINLLANQNSDLEIYPNPISTIAILQTDNFLKNASLLIYNMFGQQIKKIENLTGKSIKINRDDLPNGIYFIKLIEANKILSNKKIVVTD